jgi:hypothetical protein
MILEGSFNPSIPRWYLINNREWCNSSNAICRIRTSVSLHNSARDLWLWKKKNRSFLEESYKSHNTRLLRETLWWIISGPPNRIDASWCIYHHGVTVYWFKDFENEWKQWFHSPIIALDLDFIRHLRHKIQFLTRLMFEGFPLIWSFFPWRTVL